MYPIFDLIAWQLYAFMHLLYSRWRMLEIELCATTKYFEAAAQLRK